MSNFIKIITLTVLLSFIHVFAQSPGGVSGNIGVWLKADAGINGAGADTDGDAVNTWTDQGTMAGDASAAALASPDYRNNSTDNINGNPVVEFNGTDDGMDYGANNFFATGNGMHWFAVLKPHDEATTKSRQKIIDYGLYANSGYGFAYGDEAYGFFTSVNYNGAITVDQTHSNGTDPTIVSFQIGFGVDQKMVFNGAAPVSTQAITLAALGDTQINQSTTHQANSGPLTIGQQAKTSSIDNQDGRYYSGFMAELIGYSDSLTTANKNKVETYLGLKYGITLGHNYLASVSSSDVTIYDTTGYGNNIAGVAQDVAGQALTQLSSKSINTGSLVSGTIADANISDEEYVIWGHNGTSATLTTTFDGLDSTRIDRIWKVTATGSPGSMTISIPTSVAGGLTYLVVSNSPTITNTAGLDGSYALSINGDNYEATVTFTGTQYFTFITDTPGGSGSPGGISSNLLLWLKANTGVLNGGSPATNGQAVNTWEDQAASNDATDASLSSPTYNTTDKINGNPVIEFNGTDEGLDLGSNYIFSSGTGLTWFAVVEPNSTSGQTRQRIIDFGQYDEAGYGFSYGSEAYGFFTSTSSNGAVTEDVSHSRGIAPTLVAFQVNFGNNQEIAFNGGSGQSTQSITLTDLADNKITQAATHQSDSGPFTIGQQSQTSGLSGTYYNGKIAEIAGYSTVLSTNDRNRIETYLALKYGLTLAHNYVADISGATTIYDISTYPYDVAGIGKDQSNQELKQLSSKSVNDSGLVTITVDNANIDEDEYLVWGNDNVSDTLTASFESVNNVRLGRIWKITETGNIGDVTLSIPTSVAPNLTFLVVSGTSTITSTSDLVGSYELTVNGSNYETTVNFSSNSTRYFTFISSAPGGTSFPGGISSDLEAWYKADDGPLNAGSPASDGQQVNTWEDRSGNVIARDATDTNLDAPDFRDNTTNDINGNPVVEFNGTTDGLDLGGTYIYSSSSHSGMTWFSVLQPNTETGKTRQRIIDFGENTAGGYGFSYGSEAYGFYTSTTEIVGFGTGAETVDQTHSNGTNPTLVTFEINYGSSGTQSMAFNGNAAATSQGFSLLALTSSNIGEAATHGATTGPVTIGQQSMTNNITLQNGRRYSGTMAEVIGYSSVLSTTDKNKVETYMAIKYGLTLGHNYIADISSVNTTVYNVSSYANNIAGVGQDNVGEGLNQLSSLNQNSGALVSCTVSDANIDDEEYIIWGNDGNPTTLDSTFEGGSGTRMDRVWKVTETGTVGDVTISIPTSVAAGLTYILVANSPAMSVTADLASWAPLTINGSNYEATVNFASGSTQYFTFTSSNDASLPVTLTSFAGESVDGSVKLSWVTESQVNNAGFEIWRSAEESNNFEMIAGYKENPSLAGEGNTSEKNVYTYFDTDVEIGKTYSYQLSDVDFSGVRTFHKTVSVQVTQKLPKNITLYANYPNPFNPETKIEFFIPENKAHIKVAVRIYNILGQLVNTLVNEKVNSGKHSFTWNGYNNRGQKLPTGIYFFELRAANFRQIRKMMMIK